MGAAARLPIVVPDHAAVARVDRPGIIGRRHINYAINHENAAAQPCAATSVQIAAAEATGDNRYRRCRTASAESTSRGRITGTGGATSGGKSGDPGEAQVLDGGLVDEL